MRRSLLVLAGLALSIPVGAEIPPSERRSDTASMSPGLQAMQADDAANPGVLSVLDGEGLWSAPAGAAGRSCSGCHGEAPTSMRGVAARYPAWSATPGRPVDLAGKIDECRTLRQEAAPLAPESPERLALAAFVAHQSRGMPIRPSSEPGMAAARDRGRALFTARFGQLNLSCATCHDDNRGRSLAGTAVPQGHPVGYPIYRLEWQATGSLQRRFRNCMAGVRAEPFDYGSAAWIDLEAYLMARASGLPIETPAIRP